MRNRPLLEEKMHAYALVSRAELETDKALSRPLKKLFLLDSNTCRDAALEVLLTLASFVYFH